MRQVSSSLSSRRRTTASKAGCRPAQRVLGGQLVALALLLRRDRGVVDHEPRSVGHLAKPVAVPVDDETSDARVVIASDDPTPKAAAYIDRILRRYDLGDRITPP